MSDLSHPPFQRALIQPDPFDTHVSLITDHPVPTASASTTEHLVRVHTTAITKGELLWSQNLPPALSALKTAVPCNDVAGTVLTAPPHSPFPPGTEVYARSDFRRAGSARQYTLLLTAEMARRPRTLAWPESACVPMSAQTAWQALFVHAGLLPRAAAPGAPGPVVFVTAASGGVGVWVVQLAKWAGARVVASCGRANVARVRSLGADEVLARQSLSGRDWVASRGARVDVVVDCAGGDALADAWWVVRDGGRLISVVQPPASVRPPGVEGKRVEDSFFIMESDGAQLGQITEMIEEGIARPAMDSVFSLDDYLAAFERVPHASGKVVLDLGGHD